MYIARQLSFSGVTFTIEEISLSKEFITMYDSAVEFVSIIHPSVHTSYFIHPCIHTFIN